MLQIVIAGKHECCSSGMESFSSEFLALTEPRQPRQNCLSVSGPFDFLLLPEQTLEEQQIKNILKKMNHSISQKTNFVSGQFFNPICFRLPEMKWIPFFYIHI